MKLLTAVSVSHPDTIRTQNSFHLHCIGVATEMSEDDISKCNNTVKMYF